MCRELRCKPETLNSYLKKMNLVYTGNKGGKGKKNTPTRKSANVYLYQGSIINTHKLRQKLLEDKLKDARCERCGGSKWLNESIPLELHHVNGDRFDNRIENLQLLCPNCHALTDNHAGRSSAKKLDSI